MCLSMPRSRRRRRARARCWSTALREARARSLGADHVVDYAQTDFTLSGQCYDLILAVNGYHPIEANRRALCPGGHYVMVGGSAAQVFQALLLGPWLSRGGQATLGVLEKKPGREDLELVKGLIETGAVSPVIDRTYSLCEVPGAIRTIEAGHVRGKAVITVAE